MCMEINGLRLKDDEEIKTIANILVAKAVTLVKDKIIKIILYGSYARHEADEESDIDIMYLLDIDNEEVPFYQSILSKINSEVGLEFDVLITGIAVSNRIFNKYKEAMPFYRNVQREGTVLYERIY